MDLSIIVPVYNVESYLRECLDSLLDQNLKDYEVIIVNDGSTDLSQPIIDEYVFKHANFHAFLKPNGGLSDARNYGLRFAKGEYIAFLDSDDYVAKDGYAKMLKIAKAEDADIVIGDLVYFWSEENKEKITKDGISDVSGDKKKDLFLSPLFAWNKIYKRSFFKELKINYPLGLWYEDIPVTLTCFAKAQKVGYLHEPIFNYRQRSASIMNSSYDPRMESVFAIFDLLLENLERFDLKKTYDSELEYLFVEHFLVYGAFRFLRLEAPHYRKLMDEAFDYVKKHYPKAKRNPYVQKVFSKKERFFLATNNRFSKYLWHLYLKEHQ